ncbi:MAG TPA: hypothetical protein VII06_36500 [Chloroflexota bacterium]|jgi:hypothetical protein
MAGLRRAGLIVLAALGLSFAIGGLAWAAPEADASSTLIVIDSPKGGNTSTQIEVRGWAADPNARGGTGVDRVDVYLDGERDAGGTRLGQATYGLQRPDVAANLGSQQFLLSGFALQATVDAGPHTVYVYAHPSDQSADQGWTPPKQAAVMAVAGAPPPGAVAGIPGGVATLRSPVASGSVTLDMPGGGAYYPPGPADTGGPVYAPPYFGYGFYGGVPPFPDYSLYGTAAVVPPGFDFSLGYGSSLFGVGSLYPGYGYGCCGYYSSNYSSLPYPYYPTILTNGSANTSFYNYVLPAWARGSYVSGPIYCPLYTAVVC